MGVIMKHYRKDYSWRIVAKDDNGHRTESPVRTFTTLSGRSLQLTDSIDITMVWIPAGIPQT
jgi:hypothetical protein